VSPPRTRTDRPDGCTAVPEGGPRETDLVQGCGAGASKRGTEGKRAFVLSCAKRCGPCANPCAA